MADLKLPKYRIIAKAKEYVNGKEEPNSKKLQTLMTAIAADQDYWLWVNEALFESFTWASEAMAAKLNKAEVLALKKHLERNDLHLVHFDDTKAYQAIIIEAISATLLSLQTNLNERLRKLEEDTACVLKFTKDGAIATGYSHGIPLTAYFTNQGVAFVVYVMSAGSNKVFSASSELPYAKDHILYRATKAIENNLTSFEEACKIESLLKNSKARLDNLEKFGMTGF